MLRGFDHIRRRLAGVRDAETSRALALVAPALILIVGLVLFPMIFTFAQSFAPREPGISVGGFTLEQYRYLFSAEAIHYWRLMFRSLGVALTAAFLVIFTAYPVAWFLAFGGGHSSTIWLVLLTIPTWISYLLRIFAWKIILGFNGVVNSGLKALGIIDQPLDALLYNSTAVILALAHSWSAFAVLPIYVSLQKIDRSLFEASIDLGDTPLKRFLRITLPLSMPGVFGGFALVFIPVMADYITPQLLGGTSGVMIGASIASLFGKEDNAPLGAALSIVTMGVTISVVMLLVTAASMARLWPGMRTR